MLKKVILTSVFGCLVGASGLVFAHTEAEMETEELAGKLQRKLSLNSELANDVLDVKVVDGQLVIVGMVDDLADKNAINKVVDGMKLDREVVDNVILNN